MGSKYLLLRQQYLSLQNFRQHLLHEAYILRSLTLSNFIVMWVPKDMAVQYQSPRNRKLFEKVTVSQILNKRGECNDRGRVTIIFKRALSIILYKSRQIYFGRMVYNIVLLVLSEARDFLTNRSQELLKNYPGMTLAYTTGAQVLRCSEC